MERKYEGPERECSGIRKERKMNWLKKFGKKEIDERQQADLNRVTSYGYWIAFYLLIAAILVEGIILNRPFREWAVEWGVFMIIAVYEVIACIRIGVWTETRQKPEKKDYVRYSLIGSTLFSIVFTLGYYFRLKPENRTFAGIASMFVYWFVLLTVLFLIAYFIGGGIYNRRKKKIEEELDKELEEEETEDENE